MYIRKLLNKFGIDIIRAPKFYGDYNPYCEISSKNKKIVDVESLANISTSIPGMIEPKSGQFLFALCYMQELHGDVVEIGSWQGRSTSFLARAVENSGNGKLFAIDHFSGNPGKEKFYMINGTMNNLKNNFESNMERIGLFKTVNLMNTTNEVASKQLGDTAIRFLFIDGDHTKEGVKKDIQLFFPKLTKGSIVVFDDYFKGFPGVIEAIDELLETISISRIFYYRHTLVLKI